MVCDKTTQDYPKANVGFFLYSPQSNLFYTDILIYTHRLLTDQYILTIGQSEQVAT